MIYDNLYDWQKNIVNEFHDRNSFGVFLDCGLGKTPLTLAFAESHQADKILIVTINPKAEEKIDSAGSWGWWINKMEKNYRIVNKKTKVKNFSQDDEEAFIINYEGIHQRGEDIRSGIKLKQDITDFINSCEEKNVVVILDESHRIKDTSSLQTKALFKIKKDLSLIANDLHIYLATGTPFTKNFIDLYSQLNFLGMPMNKTSFVDRFCVRANLPGLLGWQQPIKSYKNLDELFGLVHQYAITMKSSDVIKLPEQVFIDHPLPPSSYFKLLTKAKIQGKEVDEELLSRGQPAEHDGSGSLVPNPFYRNISYPEMKWFADMPGNFWLRARQISIGFQGNSEEAVWYDESRLNELEKFLSENEDNYVLFYNYTPELLMLYPLCERLGYNIDVYSGEAKSLIFYEKYSSLTPEERLVNKKNIILSNFASGSTGMNWQNYSNCIIFSIPLYNTYEQALKRVHRIGQSETVFYHIFYQNNFLDKGMIESLNKKEDYNDKMFMNDLMKGDEK